MRLKDVGDKLLSKLGNIRITKEGTYERGETESHKEEHGYSASPEEIGMDRRKTNVRLIEDEGRDDADA